MITPLGGFCFLIGWLLIVYEAIKMKSSDWFLIREKLVLISGTRQPLITRINTNYLIAFNLK
jgi:hypothetical protein